MINQTIINITHNFTKPQLTYIGDIPPECYIKGNEYSVKCIYEWFCPQISQHIVKFGIIIVIVYIFMCWFLWWFLNYGYKKFNWDDAKGKLDLSDLDNRIYWDMWIRARLTNFMLAYIVMVLWFNMRF